MGEGDRDWRKPFSIRLNPGFGRFKLYVAPHRPIDLWDFKDE